MIPADVANTLRANLVNTNSATQSQTTQPIAPAQRIADILSNLVPGQRIFAEIQGMLANGSYRATVAQRDITLALPFAAKAGDSLELEVVESDGNLTLAFVANKNEIAEKPGQQSVSTSLSSAGKLIGDLMQGIDGEGKRAPAAPLNGNQALVSTMPRDAAQLAPMLKQALTQSGMFYEAHQARWVAGQIPTEQLRQEPQGRVLVSSSPLEQSALTKETGSSATDPKSGLPAVQIKEDGKNMPATGVERADSKNATSNQSPSATTINDKSAPSTQQSNRTDFSPAIQQTGTAIPREIAPLIQQQLDGLANQNFAWQGQIWPGQKMWWEIGENPEERNLVGEDATAKWHTRLKLTLPLLGGIDAKIHLQPGGELGIRIVSSSNEGEALMRDKIPSLHKQLEAAGLTVRQILIDHDPAIES